MSQSNVDQDYINNIYRMIESLEDSSLEKQEEQDYDAAYGHLQEPYDTKIGSETMGRRKGFGGQYNYAPDYSRHRQGAPEGRKVPQQQGMMTAADEDELPEADHWCPDVQAWHTADHEPANPPQVHINVSNNGDDPYASENSDNEGGEVQKIIGDVLGAIPLVGGALEAIMEADDDEVGEYDQNTNLPAVSQEVSEDSIAAPFLRRRDTSEEVEEDEGEEGGEVQKIVGKVLGAIPLIGDTLEAIAEADDDEVGSGLEKSIDALKIWATVDKALPKIEDNLTLVDDINILKSFELDPTTNVEELIKGTLVYKMLTDRESRPTLEWWESSMILAKSLNTLETPAFLAAFLYYEPETFYLGDFIEKAERSTQGKHQDLEMMPNSSGGDGMAGLGLMADGGPGDDEDCD